MTTVKVKGLTVELNGEPYVIPPMALGDLEQLQDRIAKFSGDITDMGQVATVIDAAHAALKRNYPDMNRSDVAGLIDVGNIGDIFEAIMDVSGLKRKAQEQAALGVGLGEAQAG